jgi:demethylmenaquinone methyltransferase/2-methoxy-6-polyprenyl-1,4-benzoquinol methylase
MLARGRDRLTDANPALVQCDAERLPSAVISIVHWLRAAQCDRKAEALREMTFATRWLRLVLEFSQVWALKPLYDAFVQILPRLGRLVTGNEPSYRYLAESIRMHPSQEELKVMMATAGLERVEYWNLTAGVVALHRGYRF